MIESEIKDESDRDPLLSNEFTCAYMYLYTYLNMYKYIHIYTHLYIQVYIHINKFENM
jgi:hypothetical protein